MFSAFILYFLLIFSIGLISHHKLKTSTDFIVGGRSLNFWLTAFSAHASDMSSWLFMAFPALIFSEGVPQISVAIGLIFGMWLNWQFVAKRLRLQTESYSSCTLSTFFENRFADNSGILRLLTALLTLFFLACYLSAGLIAMGYLFESVFYINYYVGLTIAVFVVLIYTLWGGFISVAWVDLFQALFLLLVIVVIPFVALAQMGAAPLEAITRGASARDIPLSFFGVGTGTLIFTALGWGLGYFGQPHILTKFMGIRDASEIYKSKWVGMIWLFLALSGSAMIAWIGIGFFPKGLQNSELVFVEMVKILLSPFVAGWILCALIGANMSTMDSQILVCSSVISEDFYKHFMKKIPLEKELLMVTRCGVVVVSLLALGIAFMKSTTVGEMVLYAWSGLGSSFGPLVLMSLYSKNTNRYGAIAGILVGGMTAVIWPVINSLLVSFTIPPMLPGFFLSLFAIWAISKLFHSR